jgi:ketosteroid isomerase-like protein
MLLTLPLTLALFAVTQEPVQQASPEVGATVALEELRKAELMLDGEAFEPYLAASFTLVDQQTRLSGSFAYLEPIRRQRERGDTVKELRFETPMVHVFGTAAIISYHYVKTFTEAGGRRHEEGWSTDVFTRRDDGTWMLVHRHRGRR